MRRNGRRNETHVVELVQEREVVVRADIAGDARIAVPVPGAADVSAALDDADGLHALGAELGGGQERGEAAWNRKKSLMKYLENTSNLSEQSENVWKTQAKGRNLPPMMTTSTASVSGARASVHCHHLRGKPPSKTQKVHGHLSDR